MRKASYLVPKEPMITKTLPLSTVVLAICILSFPFEAYSSLRVDGFHPLAAHEEFYEFPVEENHTEKAPLPPEELITLMSNDGEAFLLTMPLAHLSETLKLFIEDHSSNPTIVIPDISGSTMRKVVAIIKRLSHMPKKDFDEMKLFTLPFKEVLRKGAIIQALHYLQVPMVVFIVEDDIEIALPLLMALETPTLKQMINEDELDKPIRMPTQKSAWAQSAAARPSSINTHQAATKPADGVPHADSQAGTAKEPSALVPSFKELEDVLDTIFEKVL